MQRTKEEKLARRRETAWNRKLESWYGTNPFLLPQGEHVPEKDTQSLIRATPEEQRQAGELGMALIKVMNHAQVSNGIALFTLAALAFDLARDAFGEAEAESLRKAFDGFLWREPLS